MLRFLPDSLISLRSSPLLTAGLLAAGLFATGLFVGCGAEAGAPPPESEPATVTVTEARRADRPLTIHASGRLASKAEIRLSFKIDGVIETILVDEGDRVRRGEPLARLNLAEIDARVMEAESALNKARRDFGRTQRLHRDSVATLEAVQDARTAVEVAEARVQAARFNRQHAVIEAPEAGRILRRTADAGEYVRPGQPIVTLGAVNRGWVVRAGLPAPDVVRVALGDTAHVALDAFPGDTTTARVTEIADAADPRTGTFEVELAVPDAADRLKSGFLGHVAVFPSQGPRYVEIPATALVTGHGSRGVVLEVDTTRSTIRRRSVSIARIRTETVALAGGLAPGAVVVTAGIAGLSEGDRVRVTRDAGPPTP